jgi:hypothetical protein
MRHSFGISPLLQSHLLEFSSDLPFERGAELLNTALPNAGASGTQSQRLTQYYGNLEEVESVLTKPGFDFKKVEKEQDNLPAGKQVLYVEVDGGHLRTDDGYRETKVGRIFGAHQISKKSSDYEGVKLRMALEQSDYMAQLGSCNEFTVRFDELIDNHLRQTPDVQMVAISDGAEWIARWLLNRYPNAVVILDFYHALEHLACFAKTIFGDEVSCSQWIQTCSKELLEGQIDRVIAAIRLKKSACTSTADMEQADKLISYYENNRYRMKYNEYRAAGVCIGSGAIESAISTVVQQRCKLVGQRWTNRVTAVLNIRAVFKSKKRDKLRSVISQQMGERMVA